jgi:hypothetical protein
MFPLPRRLATGFALPVLAVVLLFLGTACSYLSTTPAPISLSDTAGDLAVFPFLPAAGKNTGGAILIVPDAAIAGSNVDAASLGLARWLAKRGMASFVLRYGGSAAAPTGSAADVTRALSLLRARATEFKIASDRIGVGGLGRGAALAASAGYGSAGTATPAPASTGAGGASARPAFIALFWGAGEVPEVPRDAPPTFLAGSTLGSDSLTGMIDLWNRLRAARVPVDAHFFAKRDPAPEATAKNPTAYSWPEMFYTWIRFQGYLTDQPRIALKGMAYLDGHVLPQGYVIFTPIDFVGAGPIVARVINSTAGVPLGQFTVPAGQGPVPGRYKVEMRQNNNWWLSNSFSGALVGGGRGGGAPSPEQAYFGHHRVLAPSLDDQRVYTKAHPGDATDYVIEFKPDSAANNNLKIEVFTK